MPATIVKWILCLCGKSPINTTWLGKQDTLSIPQMCLRLGTSLTMTTGMNGKMTKLNQNKKETKQEHIGEYINLLSNRKQHNLDSEELFMQTRNSDISFMKSLE